MKKSFGWGKWVFLLLLLAGGYGAWRWYGKRASEAPVVYKTVALTKGELVQQVTANGQISPVKNVTVGTQVSGIIKEMYVDFNSRVTNGQVIARIDPSTYEQNLEQVQAELANSKAALEYTELNYKRAKQLSASSLIPTADYDKAVVDLHQAEAVVRMRVASVRKAAVDLEADIYAVDPAGILRADHGAPGRRYVGNSAAFLPHPSANDPRRHDRDPRRPEVNVADHELRRIRVNPWTQAPGFGTC